MTIWRILLSFSQISTAHQMTHQNILSDERSQFSSVLVLWSWGELPEKFADETIWCAARQERFGAMWMTWWFISYIVVPMYSCILILVASCRKSCRNSCRKSSSCWAAVSWSCIYFMNAVWLRDYPLLDHTYLPQGVNVWMNFCLGGFFFSHIFFQSIGKDGSSWYPAKTWW